MVHADDRGYVFTRAQVKFFEAALVIETNARGQKTPPRLEVSLLDSQRALQSRLSDLSHAHAFRPAFHRRVLAKLFHKQAWPQTG